MREISGLAKFGYFCVGLFGGLFGVLAAWFMGKDGWGWSEGGKLFAWFGCLFWLIVWVVMVVTGGIAAFLGHAVLTRSRQFGRFDRVTL